MLLKRVLEFLMKSNLLIVVDQEAFLYHFLYQTSQFCRENNASKWLNILHSKLPSAVQESILMQLSENRTMHVSILHFNVMSLQDEGDHESPQIPSFFFFICEVPCIIQNNQSGFPLPSSRFAVQTFPLFRLFASKCEKLVYFSWLV